LLAKASHLGRQQAGSYRSSMLMRRVIPERDGSGQDNFGRAMPV
jgi:hypothetical protein